MRKSRVVIAVFLLFSGVVFAQPQKGMMELALSGPVFLNYSDDGSRIAPTGFLGYFVSPKLEVGGRLGLISYSNRSDYNGGNVGVEGAYHFSANEKYWTYAAVGLNSYFGDVYSGDGSNPIQVKGEIGVKFWPLPGGAVKVSGMIIQQFPEERKETIVGVDLGILIRLK